MKILLTVHQFFPDYTSGTEVLACSVAHELIARGHEVLVFTGYPADKELKDEERFDEYEYEGIHVHRFLHAYAPMAGQTSMIELGYDNRLGARYFERLIEQFKPDLVHFFHLNRLGTGLIESAVRAGIPAFMTPTDFWMICPTANLLLSDGRSCLGPSNFSGNCVKHFAELTQKGAAGTLAKFLPTSFADLFASLAQTDILPSSRHLSEVKAIGSRLAVNIARLNQLNKIIAPNHFMREMLVRYGAAQDQIVQSAFGINLKHGEMSKPRQQTRQPFRIGFIGTLVSHKGCHVLIEAFRKLPVGRAILKIYGNENDFPAYSAELRQLAANQSGIEFCGVFHNSKIAEVMADLDVLAVPSLWYENTPLVLYSAQAAYCPVIASDFPGISEVIRDGFNGLLYKAGDVAALAGKLARLIDEPDLAVRLSANCQQPKPISVYVDELLDIWSAH